MKTLILKPKEAMPASLAYVLVASKTKRELLALAKEYGVICDALKYETAWNIASKIVTSENLTITIKHK